MALNVAQYEEIAGLLREVPRLVDRLEARHSGFAENVLAWLKQAETALQNNRIPAVSQIASCRATLIGAGRGVRSSDVAFGGRATPRKIRDATASMVLERGNQLLHGVIAERQAVFQEAERIARQIMAIADAKGLIRACDNGRPHQVFLNCLQQSIAHDSDLVNAYSHLIALVGKTDVVIFMDRSLESVKVRDVI
jgi:hypothetical protein